MTPNVVMAIPKQVDNEPRRVYLCVILKVNRMTECMDKIHKFLYIIELHFTLCPPL